MFFVDVPGFMVGKDAEAAATLREGMRAVYVGLQASVPSYLGGISLWAAALVLISAPRTFALWMRLTGFIADATSPLLF